MPPKDKDAFPTKQVIILGLCRFSEPLAFNSILAYSYVMVKDLGISEKDASFCSGMLVSAYAIAEALTALGWGAISDVYGRKPVALIGLAGVALSSIIFGMAQSFWVALLARFVGGALNGNVAIMQTMLAEMITNPEHEPRAYATQPFVWTLGGIIGSAMGGFLAQPAKFYPDVFSEDGIFGRYPYLLPNLVAAGGIILAIIQGALFLEETKPDTRKDNRPAAEDGDADERTPLNRNRERNRDSVSRGSHVRPRSNSVIDALRRVTKRPSFLEDSMPMPTDQRFDLRRTSFGTMHSIMVPHDLTHELIHDATAPRRTFNFTVIMITISQALIAFHQMAFVTAMPVYILDKPHVKAGLDLIGGLGYTLHDVGTYLAVNGFIALFIQGLIFPLFVENVGVYRSFVIMVILYPTCYIIVPFLSALPHNLVASGIYLSFVLQAFYGIIVFPCALIMLKNAAPSPLVLGKVNGLAMSACCLARTISPPLVGVIYAFGGSAAAWFSCAFVALLGIVQMFWVPNEHVKKVEVESGLKTALRPRPSASTLRPRPSVDFHEEAIMED